MTVKQDEMKERVLKYEQSSPEPETQKMTVEEMRAELLSLLDSGLDAYISDSLRRRRLAETTTGNDHRRIHHATRS